MGRTSCCAGPRCVPLVPGNYRIFGAAVSSAADSPLGVSAMQTAAAIVSVPIHTIEQPDTQYWPQDYEREVSPG